MQDNGSRTKGDCFSVGSGSLNALSVLDQFRKEEMTDEEALALGRKAIMHATYRDIGSGGHCNCEQHVLAQIEPLYFACFVNYA